VSQGGGSKEAGPYESLDGDYEADVAFGWLAYTKLRQIVDTVEEEYLLAHVLHDIDTPLSRSASKSGRLTIGELRRALDEMEVNLRGAAEAVRDDKADPYVPADYELLMQKAQEASLRLVPALQDEDPVGVPWMPTVDPSTLIPADEASELFLQRLRAEVRKRRNMEDIQDVILGIVTAGVGKTYGQLLVAIEEALAKKRVAIVARTKERVGYFLAPDAERNGDSLIERAQEMCVKNPAARRIVHLSVFGRDENTCLNFEAVKATQEHGMTPGRSVCLGCEHHPRNAPAMGLPICPYYEMRMTFAYHDKAFRGNRMPYPPIAYSTHACFIATSSSGGNQYGDFTNIDMLQIDEDPTDSIENDVVVSMKECSFSSGNHAAVTEAGALLTKAKEIAERDRSKAASEGFRAPGSNQYNTHKFHSESQSTIFGEGLHDLLDRAYIELKGSGRRIRPAVGVLRDAGHVTIVAPEKGQLAHVKSTDDINGMGFPSNQLIRLCKEIYSELELTEKHRRILVGKYRSATSAEERRLHSDTGLPSYVARLDYVKPDPLRPDMPSGWRYVVRLKTDFQRPPITVVGDAYGDAEHYEGLFDVKPEVISVHAKMHPGARLRRVRHGGVSIGRLKKDNAWQPIVLLVEQQLELARIAPGDRLLVYGHLSLRSYIEPELLRLQHKYGLAEVAYEHWWGGRGKDHYNGWEYCVCISDPVMNIGATLHVANARAFWDATKPAASDERVMECARQVLPARTSGHSAARKLIKSDERMQLESDRGSLAELVQALHRTRPVRHPTTGIFFSGMQLHREILAQSETVSHGSDGTGRHTLGRPPKRAGNRLLTDGWVEDYVHEEEAYLQMLNVIDHLGCMGVHFLHAFGSDPGVLRIGLLNTGVKIAEAQYPPKMSNGDDNLSEGLANSPQDGTTRLGDVRDRTEGTGPRVAQPGGPRPEARLVEPEAVGGRIWTTPMRIWHPSPYWHECGVRTVPKALQKAWRRLLKEAKAGDGPYRAQSIKLPDHFGKRGGRPPTMVFHADTDPITARDLALRVLNQYGPLSQTTKQMHRPNFGPNLPLPWAEVPF